MNRFNYVRPQSLAEALGAGSAPGAAFLAGGTNLLDLMKLGLAAPATLVDLARLPDLSAVETLASGAVRIGALVKNADLAHDKTFAAAFPAVAEALLSGASPQLRNAATVGGNILQRTRCPYFFDREAACNKRTPGSGCDAGGGETRTQAVLGWSTACTATHPSDFCVPLTALDAVVEIAGPDGLREMPLETLHRLPGDTPHVETALSEGEIILAVRLPGEAGQFAPRSRYLKVRDRTSYAFALVSAAAALVIKDGKITDVRLCLGGVAAKPWRAREAEAVLVGARPDAERFRAAAEAALSDARPVGGNGFKIELAKRVASRALLMAATGTPDRVPALPASPFSSRVHDGARV